MQLKSSLMIIAVSRFIFRGERNINTLLLQIGPWRGVWLQQCQNEVEKEVRRQ